MKTIMSMIIILIILSAPAIFAKCNASMDMNHDGVAFAATDVLHLHAYLMGVTDTMPFPYEGDLNSDCVIDWYDYYLYQDYLTYGISIFNSYGGYPVPTCCDMRDSCCIGIRGNVNNDTQQLVNILDITYLNNWLYSSGSSPNCIKGADVNSDGNINLLDITYLINYIYKGGPAPGVC